MLLKIKDPKITMQKRISLLFFISLFFYGCLGQNTDVIRIEKNEQDTNAAFEKNNFNCLTKHICINAMCNDSLPIRLMFDSGADWIWLDSTFIDNHYGFDSKYTMYSSGIGQDGKRNIKAFENIKIAIDSKEKVFVYVPAPNLRMSFGDTIDGIIGLNFIQKYIWSFNFDSQKFYLVDNIPDSVYKTWKALSLIKIDKRYYLLNAKIDFTDSLALCGMLLFDTGYPHDIGIFNNIGEKYNLFDLVIYGNKTSYGGASGKTESVVISPIKLSIDDFVINKPETRVSKDKFGFLSNAKIDNLIGICGFQTVQRMRSVIIDFPSGILYYKPNSIEQ